MQNTVKIAIEGCAHGELDKIYESLTLLQSKENITIDLLICCGDFQAVRNMDDLLTLACPPKYRSMNSFYKYYSGEAVAPILTLFIGGNHESSSHNLELFHGGWVAPNIYFMGFAGVVDFRGIRIGGLSGIFKSSDFRKGHFEYPPFTESTMRSAYHVREFEVFQLKQLLPGSLDIFLSHDWPTDIANFGNLPELLRRKPFLRDEINCGSFGSPAAAELLQVLQPSFWFSAHLHVKYPALFRHSNTEKVTKFLALDKCLPQRDFLQVIEVPARNDHPGFRYDAEWLSIVKRTHMFLSLQYQQCRLPIPRLSSSDEVEWVRARLVDASIPCNFSTTLPFHDPNQPQRHNNQQPDFIINPQTAAFLHMLELPDVFSQHFCRRPSQSSSIEQLATFNPDEIVLDEPAPGSNDGAAVDVTHNPDEIDLS